MSENHECLWARAGVGCVDHWRSDKQDWIGEFICKQKPKKAKVRDGSRLSHRENSSWEGYCRSGLQRLICFFWSSSSAHSVVGEKGACVYGVISVVQWTLLLHHYFLLSPTSSSPGITATHPGDTVSWERRMGSADLTDFLSQTRSKVFFEAFSITRFFYTVTFNCLFFWSQSISVSPSWVLSHAKFLQYNFAGCIFKEKTFVDINHSIGPLR